MTPSTILLAGAVVGMLLQSVTLVGIVWRGGKSLGRMDEVLSRTVSLVDKIEDRVGRLEGRH